MFSKSKLKSQAGFSLIELMIVVAIIGVLAAIAVPNFQRFQAKAKQTEAKTNLTSLFTAEKAFFAEWNQYYGDFRDVGVRPEGQIRYNFGFGAAGAPPAPPFNPIIAGGAAGTAFNTSVNAACAAPGCTRVNAIPAWAQAAVAGTCGAGANPAGTGAGATFRASAIGNVGAATNDVWTMDNNKTICNNVAGLP